MPPQQTSGSSLPTSPTSSSFPAQAATAAASTSHPFVFPNPPALNSLGARAAPTPNLSLAAQAVFPQNVPAFASNDRGNSSSSSSSSCPVGSARFLGASYAASAAAPASPTSRPAAASFAAAGAKPAGLDAATQAAVAAATSAASRAQVQAPNGTHTQHGQHGGIQGLSRGGPAATSAAATAAASGSGNSGYRTSTAMPTELVSVRLLYAHVMAHTAYPP